MTYKILRLLFLLAACIIGRGNHSSAAHIEAKSGVLDLRSENFNQVVSLTGEWEFYWRKFVLQDIKDRPQFVTFPKKWNDLKVDGRDVPSFGYATYRLKVLLPKTAEMLRIGIPDVYCAYDFYLNGVLVAKNGQISKSAANFTPHWQYRAFDIPLDVDTAELILQVANFVHYKGGVKDPIILGTKTSVVLERNRVEAIDLLLTGCLFMGGLFFLGLYLRGSRDKAILLFSIFCMVYCYRIMGTDNYVLHTLLPNANWYIMIHLEYCSLFLGIGIFAQYTRYLYPEETHLQVIRFIVGSCVLFCLATLLLSPYYFSQLINPFLVVTIFCIGYALYTYAFAYIRNRPGSKYALLSCISLMFAFGLSLLNYWGIVPAIQLASFIGYIAFFFFQSLILSHRVAFQLQRANRIAEESLQIKSEFLSTMSHEIRTPLNSVIGMSHLLLRNHPRPDQVQQLDVMLFSANNLLGIVNDILDFNKIEEGKIRFENQVMDVSAICGGCMASLGNFASEKEINLELNMQPEVNYRVLGDQMRLTQVLTNLIHNAIKFTAGNGKVCLKVSKLEETVDRVKLRFEVIDTGIGISTEKQQLIFERFTQADSSTSRSFGGTGLGLAISKRLLELQGSSLHVQSEVGKGSIFFFEQLLVKADEMHIESPKVDFKVDNSTILQGKEILLVEDNAINVMVARGFLEKWGATVTVAENGELALSLFDEKRHQIILMDLHMPILDGYQAAARIRQFNKIVPIIALTANLRKDIEEKVLQVGINDVIVKPFLPDELFQVLNKYLSN